MSFKKDLKLLAKPYYWINILLSLTYIVAKKAPALCSHLHPYLFPHAESCEFDSRETEILFFLIIVIMLRSRKTGSVTMINYLTSSFLYTKLANLILWFYSDIKCGIVYGVLFILFALILPEPTYSGPDNVIYFRQPNSLQEELDRDKRVVWLVTFYTTWNPACVTFAPIFAQLSNEYNLDNFKFGKVDIGRLPDDGKKYHVSDSSLSRQLPTVILFKDGKEECRRPYADNKGKLVKFFFSEDNLKAAFDLNSVHKECKENPIKTRKPIKSKDEEKKTN